MPISTALLRTVFVLGLASGCTTNHSPLPANPSAVTSVTIPATLPPMAEPVTSFAAVTHGDWLYVSGGHRGERHQYDRDRVSSGFYRLSLAAPTQWEKLPSTAPAQGLALVGHGKYLYRLGGMAARNAPGEKQDLFSYAETARFDTTQGRWEPYVSLPTRRSSHDAVVVGQQIILGGGWSLAGGTNAPAWPDTLLSLDLRERQPKWKTSPQPFRRRALAAATLRERVFFIGGMDSDNTHARR